VSLGEAPQRERVGNSCASQCSRTAVPSPPRPRGASSHAKLEPHRAFLLEKVAEGDITMPELAAELAAATFKLPVEPRLPNKAEFDGPASPASYSALAEFAYL